MTHSKTRWRPAATAVPSPRTASSGLSVLRRGQVSPPSARRAPRRRGTQVSPSCGEADESGVAVQVSAKRGLRGRHAVLQVDVRGDVVEAIFCEQNEAFVDLNGQ